MGNKAPLAPLLQRAQLTADTEDVDGLRKENEMINDLHLHMLQSLCKTTCSVIFIKFLLLL